MAQLSLKPRFTIFVLGEEDSEKITMNFSHKEWRMTFIITVPDDYVLNLIDIDLRL